MAELTRTRTGSFALEDAITLGELQTMADEGRQEEAFLSMEAALSDFPKSSFLRSPQRCCITAAEFTPSFMRRKKN